MTFALNNDVFQFGVCSFLDHETLGNLSCVSRDMKQDTSDEVVWSGSKRNCAINKLNQYIQKHYDILSHHNTSLNMKIHSWSPDETRYNWSLHTKQEIDKLDVLERVLVRNIVRRNVPKENLIEILHANDEPDEQFELLRRVILRPGYNFYSNPEDFSDLLILIDISEYANSVRRGALYIYDSISSNSNWELMNATSASMEELREPTKNYSGLLTGRRTSWMVRSRMR